MLVGRVRDRTTFDALRRSRLRSSSGVVRVVFAPADALRDRHGSAPEACVAFAVSRKVGHAVDRNRLRRRTRAVLAERDGVMMPGAYLISFTPGAAEMSFEELRTDVERALRRMVQRIDAGPGGASAPSSNRTGAVSGRVRRDG